MARCVSLIRVVRSRQFLRSSDRLILASMFILSYRATIKRKYHVATYTQTVGLLSSPTEINAEKRVSRGTGCRGMRWRDQSRNALQNLAEVALTICIDGRRVYAYALRAHMFAHLHESITNCIINTVAPYSLGFSREGNFIYFPRRATLRASLLSNFIPQIY